MDPILTYSEITGRVYIVTKYKRLDGGVIDAREKFDVTDWAESYARKRNAKTVEENAELRKTLGEYECKMDALVDSLTGGLLSKSMDTPNDSIEDAVREHVEGNLATENARLRDLAYAMWEWMGRARYDGAIRCDEMDEIGRRAVGLGLLAHELGIEAD